MSGGIVMAVPNYKQSRSQYGDKGDNSGDVGPPRNDDSSGQWADADRFSIGPWNLPQVVAAGGYANDSVGIALQTAVPSDYASFNLSLGEIVNLQAFANAGASATLTSSATGQGLLTLNNGHLTGTYTASLVIDVTAYIASINAKVTMHVTDNFQLSLSGTGYVGGSLTTTSQSGGSVTVTTPSSGISAPPGKCDGGSFDLARFAASVIGTGNWDIAFVASHPGESFNGRGTSVLSIDTTVDLPGDHKPQPLAFHDTERASLSFNDTSSHDFGGPYGLQATSSGPISMFHNV